MRVKKALFAQVALGQSKKDPNVYSALKVVFLRSPEMLQDPEHLAIMRRWSNACLDAQFFMVEGKHADIFSCMQYPVQLSPSVVQTHLTWHLWVAGKQSSCSCWTIPT